MKVFNQVYNILYLWPVCLEVYLKCNLISHAQNGLIRLEYANVVPLPVPVPVPVELTLSFFCCEFLTAVFVTSWAAIVVLPL